MTNDPINDPLRELSWRRKLTRAEEASLRTWLAAHPEAQADWEAEAGLNAALGRLPDVPVPGNFTARVLQAAEREAAAEQRRSGWIWGGWPRLRWLPKAAFAAVILGAGLVSYHQIQAARLREYGSSVAVVSDVLEPLLAAEPADVAHVNSVAAVSDVSSLPGPEILKDYDAIRASNPPTIPDEQLLAVLQQ